MLEDGGEEGEGGGRWSHLHPPKACDIKKEIVREAPFSQLFHSQTLSFADCWCLTEMQGHRTTFFPGSPPAKVVPTASSPVLPAVGNNETPDHRTENTIKPFQKLLFTIPIPSDIQKPWSQYNRIMEVDQAGPAVLAHKRNRGQKIVAIKEVKGCSKDLLRSLRTSSHENVLPVYAALFDEGSIFLVYDSMDVSQNVCLSDIIGTPRGSLDISEVATVCQSITKGLHHIHDDLKVAHGAIRGETILLHPKSGQIKIGMHRGGSGWFFRSG